ncbi:DUF4326 domain-containing protein [Streptomyces sp. NPDC001262]|uniref:DUF4326 domain-containing protein n=1 Tax=Streptomyces sp. NPDC001262 TaxID=3364552 RepID=UPI0036998BE0
MTHTQLDLFAPEPAPQPASPLPLPPGRPGEGRALQPMTAAAVEWVAQHVIADYHLANEHTYGDPDQNWETRCACQHPCLLCRDGHHERCRELRRTGGPLTAPRPETHLRAPAPYRPDRAASLYTDVWLADRACRLLCDCAPCAGRPAPTTVVCLKGRQGDLLLDDPRFVYVGRPLFTGGWRLKGHPLANPFKLGRDGTSEEVVALYRMWIRERPEVLNRELSALRGKVLGCWCPDGQPCHARVLAELADKEVTG